MKKVVLGLSGGVDSSVAAIRLLEKGYDVEAVYMRNWDSATNNDFLGNPEIDNEVCSQEKDYQDAKKVAEKLGIKMHRVDFVKEYWDLVFKHFLDEYKKGRTPNPDIMCNKEIKFKAFLKYALTLDCDYIAMGHYAQVLVEDNDVFLLRAKDDSKDQTYFLCQLTKEQLTKSLFPIGDLLKKEVRKIAKKNNLVTADKKDSTGICFIGERNFNGFLKNYLANKPGNMVDLEGNILGTHEGLIFYTIGQRKGIRIGGLDGYKNEPWFVIGKKHKTNELIIGQGFDNDYVYSNSCLLEGVNWLWKTRITKCTAKFRYRQKDNDVIIEHLSENKMMVYYNNVRAVTPGQACVFYLNEYCLGGGTISEVYKEGIKANY